VGERQRRQNKDVLKMTPAQIAAVQSSFSKVAPIADQAAAMFYGRLFELDPSLRKLFKSDMREQGKKLMGMLGTVVRELNDLSKIIDSVKGLGRGHVRYGVKPEHYATVGAALLWTLEKGLGKAFTPGVKDAWRAAYSLVAQTMIEASKTVGATPAGKAA
jgi:nitric oxide dioxygenase